MKSPSVKANQPSWLSIRMACQGTPQHPSLNQEWGRDPWQPVHELCVGSPDLAATTARVNVMFTLHEVQNNSTQKLARLLISNVRGVETANAVFAKGLWREKYLLQSSWSKRTDSWAETEGFQIAGLWLWLRKLHLQQVPQTIRMLTKVCVPPIPKS